MLFLFPDNAPQVAITAPGSGNHRNSSTGPTPDCSPPSPDTALKNIVKVIRPQVGAHHKHPLICCVSPFNSRLWCTYSKRMLWLYVFE